MATTLDLVGFSGQRVYTQLPSGFTRNEMTTAIVEGLLNVGWEKLSGPTVQAQGNGYTLRSQQSPWYDPENIPAWYVGNKIRLTIDNTQTADISFFVAADLADSEIALSSTPMIYRFTSGAGFGYNMLFNPYQLVMWSDRHPEEDPNNARYSGIIVSALNLPKFVQQKKRIVHSIFASSVNRPSGQLGSGPGGSSGFAYNIYQEKGGVVHTATNSGNVFLTLSGGFNRSHRTGRRIWNLDNDPTMGDSTQWSPFFLPARLMYATPGSGSSTFRIQGFLWDALVLTEGYELNSVMRFQTQFGVNVNFKCFAGRSLSTHTTLDGTLWFCTTPNVTT